MFKKLSYLFLICLFSLGNVSAGGDFGKIVVGLGLGVVTGGASMVVAGATTATAVTAGAVTAIGVATGAPTRAGITMNGNGNNPGVYANVTNNHRLPLADITCSANTPHVMTQSQRIQNTINKQYTESARAKETFKIEDTLHTWSFAIKHVDSKEYHQAKSVTSELLALSGRKWNITTLKKPYEGITKFTYSTEAEKLGMMSFVFEETSLIWHFDQKLVDGIKYNHAWSDGNRDFLVPTSQIWHISSADWDKAVVKTKKAEIEKKLQLSKPQVVKQEKKVPDGLTDYLDDAKEIVYKSADTVGRVVSRVGAEFATPGGVDNLKAYRDGSISHSEYARNVSLDVATDAVASALGATVGGTGGGLAAGLVTAGAGTIPMASVGSAAGATAGYVASRAVKAVERTTAAEITRELNISRAITTSGGNGNNGNQGDCEKKERQTDTHEGQRNLIEQKKSSGEWKNCDQGEWRGSYQSKDGIHRFTPTVEKRELEVYKKVGKGWEHTGIMRPSEGRIRVGNGDKINADGTIGIQGTGKFVKKGLIRK